LNKKFNYYKHRISYLTGTCYNFEMEEFFSSFLRRAGMPASARLSCVTRMLYVNCYWLLTLFFLSSLLSCLQLPFVIRIINKDI